MWRSLPERLRGHVVEPLVSVQRQLWKRYQGESINSCSYTKVSIISRQNIVMNFSTYYSNPTRHTFMKLLEAFRTRIITISLTLRLRK
jgi:hypothetical protein